MGAWQCNNNMKWILEFQARNIEIKEKGEFEHIDYINISTSKRCRYLL